MREKNELCVGIDLGTTNSLVATVRADGNRLKTPVKKVPRTIDGKGNRRNDVLLPSVVWYNPASEMPIVGDLAKEAYRSAPYRVARSIKSQMGRPAVTGLQEDIPDHTPEEVSARILRHLLNDLEKYYGVEIRDVVITVPASFDPMQRIATLRAAEIAGLDVRNADGSYDEDILLSEPEAVLYDALNQIRNGDYDANLSFDREQKVLVFDIGGGTLDITLHAVRRNSENPEILDMDLIATNRFTPVAGDTFDELVAEEMLRRCCEVYQDQLPAAARRIAENKDSVMPDFRTFAEQLKVSINERHDDMAFQNRTLPEDYEFECGNMLTIGYAYNDVFTKREYEDCVRELMGWQYSYEDYRTIEEKGQTKDIIWPVLDVLRKGAKKLGEELRVDAVILSGGMSRLYLVKERLEKFFGFHVFSASDPDMAVAQGAAVYHYHQHQDSELMKRLHAKEHSAAIAEAGKSERIAAERPMPDLFIRSGRMTMADSVYLGLRNGARMILAEEGQELPFESKRSGLYVEAGQNMVCVPIQQKGVHANEFVTIASGNIQFRTKPDRDMPVSIRFDISRNQIITIEAWMCRDEQGLEPIERGTVTFSLGDSGKRQLRGKLVPPSGSRLNPSNEVSALLTLCRQKNASVEAFRRRKQTIAACGNPEDFARPLLKTLTSGRGDMKICFHLIPLARKLAKYWSEAEQSQLAQLCYEILRDEVHGYNLQFGKKSGQWVSIYSEAILTVGLCGTERDAEKLYVPNLYGNAAYRDKLLQVFAYHGIHTDWVEDCLRREYPTAYRWIGPALSRTKQEYAPARVARIVDKLLKVLEYGAENHNTLVDAIISLGFLCDSRSGALANRVSRELRLRAEQAVSGLDRAYPEEWLRAARKAQNVALKMIRGETLDHLEEQFLLGLYEE